MSLTMTIGAVIILLGVLGIGLRGFTDSPTFAGAFLGVVVALAAGVMLVAVVALHI